MPRNAPFSVSLPPIDAFGDGGFRIASVRREGATLIVDGAARDWAPSERLSAADFALFLDRSDRPDMVVLGMGQTLVHPAPEVRRAFREAGVGLEVMDTATASRTYNLLAGEGRNIGAALLPV